MRESGFEIEKQISVSYLRAGFFKKLFPQKVLTGLESLLQAAASWTAYSPSIFLRTKAKGEATLPNTKDFFRCPACGHSPLEDTPPRIDLRCLRPHLPGEETAFMISGLTGNNRTQWRGYVRELETEPV